MATIEGTIEAVPQIGGRMFWCHAGLPDDATINSAFEQLNRAHVSGGEGPIGLCLVAGGELPAEVVWPGTQMMLAGYMSDGREIRIRYFDDAIIGPPAPGAPTAQQMMAGDYALDERYEVVPFGEAGVTHDDAISFWTREAAMPEDEAKRRADQLHMVAIEREQGIVGVSTIYVDRSEQLAMDLFHYRAFVARDHRASNIASRFALDAPAQLAEGYASGEDARGAGVLFEIENQILKTYFNRAVWLPSNFQFIGENPRADHVRVHYFPGAVVPGRL